MYLFDSRINKTYQKFIDKTIKFLSKNVKNMHFDLNFISKIKKVKVEGFLVKFRIKHAAL